MLIYAHTLSFFSKYLFQISKGNQLRSINTKSLKFDVVVVGAGIIGLATARQLSICYPKLSVCVLEKENKPSFHQSGRNSGVIHTGIYYTPGSLKAKLCVEGLFKTYDYCELNKIPFKKCGKLIVAVDESELSALDNLFTKALKNKVPGVMMVNTEGIKAIEPACKGIKAIYSPNTGIVDWRVVALQLAEDFKQSRGKLITNFEVSKIIESDVSNKFPIRLINKKKNNLECVDCEYLITCAGLQSDRIAVMSGCSINPKIIPFRGDYLNLKPDKNLKISTNIYPVPNPQFPFLGVHFTPRIDGTVLLGPTATLSFNREGYNSLKFSFKDTFDFLIYPGMYNLFRKYAYFGFKEYYRSLFINEQVKQLKRYVPTLKLANVERGPSGIRAQALDLHGSLIEDFVFDIGTGPVGSRVLHIRNSPSPGATSSMAIAKLICDKADVQFGLSSTIK